MKKRCIEIEKDFNNDCRVFDLKLKDRFNDKYYVLVNDVMESVRFIGKNPYYKRRRKKLDDMNLKHIIIPKWLEVIDIKNDDYKKIKIEFSEYKIPNKDFLNIF